MASVHPLQISREDPAPPPANVEAEAALLGALLINNHIIDEIGVDLRSDHFFAAVHGRMFDRILKLVSGKKVVTPVTLKSYFEGDDGLKELGGTAYLARLTSDGQGLLNPRELAAQIQELALQREAVALGKRLVAEASDPDQSSGDLISRFAEDLAVITAERRRGAVSASAYIWRDPTTIPPRPWVLGRWLLRCTVATVIAPGGVGKTTFLASAALSMVTGRPLLGKDVWCGPKRVWIWNLEDDLEELSRAIQAAAIHHDISAKELSGRLFVDSAMEGAQLCTATIEAGVFRLLSPVYAAVTAELKRRSIDVLIIDPFVSSHEVDESNNGLIDKVAKAWARVAKDTGSCVVLVHHVSKAGSGEVTAMSSRGASSLGNAARSTLVVNRMDDIEAKRLSIPAEERRRYIRVQDDKANRAPAEKADWFQIVGVDLGNRTDDLPSDSVGVVEPWRFPDPFDDIPADALRRVQAQLGTDARRENSQAREWFGHLVAGILDIDLEKGPGKEQVKAIIRQWINAGAFRIEERKNKDGRPTPYVVLGDPA